MYWGKWSEDMQTPHLEIPASVSPDYYWCEDCNSHSQHHTDMNMQIRWNCLLLVKTANMLTGFYFFQSSGFTAPKGHTLNSFKRFSDPNQVFQKQMSLTNKQTYK